MFSYQALTLFSIYTFFSVTITSGSSIAAGIFVPMMLCGATLGKTFGTFLQMIFPDVDPPIDSSIYALVGATALMSGFSRITISLCVIIIEITENAQYLLPIMLAVVCAKWVGDTISKSQYEEMSHLKSIPFLDYHPPHSAFALNISEIMTKDVICFDEVERLDVIVKVLRETKHNGFPVVRKESEQPKKTYRGLILRKQLLIMIANQEFSYGIDGEVPQTMSYAHYLSMMNRKWDLDNISLPPEESLNRLTLHLNNYMDRSHLVVQTSFCFIETFKLFRTQGLRYLPVVDEYFQVVGILTRHDLLFYHFPASSEVS